MRGCLWGKMGRKRIEVIRMAFEKDYGPVDKEGVR